ncbi:MAG: ribosomal protein S18-alanine N-acetyltransferase [Chloroflexi bacterium]|nr:ribosomal protein S18-alanine N-acetyltransferase [Chloroflexota bacterium]MCL5026580.1 ribosomal protein S18-alanine N-acetyltransferase [Chloroflexota bacterium]
MRFAVEPMRLEDIDEVVEVEKACFSLPWPLHAYRRELQDSHTSRYIVARMYPEPAETPPPRLSSLSGQPGFRQTLSALLRPIRRDGRDVPAEPAPPPPSPPAQIAGYGGLWFMLDEAHVTTIGVRPDLRQHGIGELLFASLTHMARDLGADRVTLEVRLSNLVAQNLYRKYGFTEEGIRRRYYSDNNEDALIMWSPPLNTPEYQRLMDDFEAALAKRLNGSMLKSAWDQGAWALRRSW